MPPYISGSDTRVGSRVVDASSQLVQLEMAIARLELPLSRITGYAVASSLSSKYRSTIQSRVMG